MNELWPRIYVYFDYIHKRGIDQKTMIFFVVSTE